MIKQLVAGLSILALTQLSHAALITYEFSGAKTGSYQAYGHSVDDVIAGTRIDSIVQSGRDSSQLDLSFDIDLTYFEDIPIEDWAFWTTTNPLASGYTPWMSSHSNTSGNLFDKTSASNGLGLTIFDANGSAPWFWVTNQNDWQEVEYHSNGAIKSRTNHLLTHLVQLDLTAVQIGLVAGKEIATDFQGINNFYLSMQHDINTEIFDETGTQLYRTNTMYFSEATSGNWLIKITPSASVPEPSSILLMFFGLSALCLRRFQR